MSPCGGDTLLRLAAHDFEHIVHGRVHTAFMHFGGALGERLHHLFLVFGGLGHNIVVFHLRRGQVQLVCGLDVRHLFEQVHQLRQIKELAESRSCPVAGAFGVEFVKILFVDFLN